MANSIQSALRETQDSATAKVKLTLDNDVNKNKVVAVVEGIDDVRLYQRMYEANDIEVVPVDNCDKIALVIRNLNRPQYRKRLIGIKDADFDVLDGKNYHLDNLFMTDFHDVEMLTLSCNAVLMHIWNKYVTDCPMPDDLLQTICLELLPLSMLKWYNSHHSLSITFDCTNIGSSFENGIFNYDTYENSLFQLSENIGRKPVSSDMQAWCAAKNPDLRMVTNGHDAVATLLVKIKQHNKHNIAKKKFSREIIDSYPMTEFINTNLADSISSWANYNHVTIKYAPPTVAIS